MKIPNLHTFFCLFVLFVAGDLYSQNHSEVDALVRSYPKFFASPQKLAERIYEDFTSDEEKARAIFVWIAINIQYDLKAYSSRSAIAYTFFDEEDRLAKERKYRMELANKLLDTGKGVCQDYTALFQTVCELSGIQCMTITGTSKTDLSHIGKLPQSSDHAWNAVKIGSAWKFVDATWASGSVSIQTGKFVTDFNAAYFFTPPDIFFLNHFPDDKRFLMTEKTAADFAGLPLYYGGYINSDYEFTAPENGIIKSEGARVVFKIINLPKKDRVAYVFSSDRKINDVPLSRIGNVCEFVVGLNKKSKGYLTIYINNKSVAGYKIVP